MGTTEILNKRAEKYYWETQDGKFIPVDTLSELHIVNITIKFGKDYLSSHGYNRIIEKFEILRNEHNFYVNGGKLNEKSSY